MPAKKTSRPRLDAVINHIRQGSYDDEMGQLRGAIDDRTRKLQQEVVKLVKSTFGEDYTVLPESQTPLQPTASRKNPFIQNPEIAAAEERARAHEAELAAEAGGTTPDPLGDDPEEGIESRSPVIGSIDPSAEPQQEEEPGVEITVEERPEG